MKISRIFALAFAAFAGTQALAQPYPVKPITMIVPFAPGGIADLTGRPLAAAMSRILGQTIVVENKPGAGGAVGHALTAKARPDGYTIMTALSSITVIPEADKVNGRPATYQMSDFTPIALISADPTVLLVPADSPWKTLKDLVEDAKSRPGKISYGTSARMARRTPASRCSPRPRASRCCTCLTPAADLRCRHCSPTRSTSPRNRRASPMRT